MEKFERNTRGCTEAIDVFEYGGRRTRLFGHTTPSELKQNGIRYADPWGGWTHHAVEFSMAFPREKSLPRWYAKHHRVQTILDAAHGN